METKEKTIEETIVWTKKPLIICGPCSAETEHQLLSTATLLAATKKVDVLRAGIWKPRTKPGNFEGVGSKGLPWLLKAKKSTGLPTAIEVATAKQVEDALSYEVDMLWIGARTTANPFSVQEIANALRGVDVPVFIKNPINPDIELWCGAVERIAGSGIKTIGLIHRGFSTYGNSNYRNPPMWHIAIDMKLRYADLMMLNDPSHICGNRTGLFKTAQKAIDLNFDGLMIESHVNPDEAWSDASQQLTPEKLNELISNITWRKELPEGNQPIEELEKYRQQINNMDDELLQILSQRMKIADKIGDYKKENNITILQPARWQDILEEMLQKADSLGLSKDFIIRYLEAVHLESINHQKKIMDGE